MAFSLPGPSWARAVPLALAAAALPSQDRSLQERIAHALDESRPALLTHLRQTVETQERVGLIALLVLAAIHDGVPADEARFAAALDHLMKVQGRECYDLALRLLVLEALPRTPERSAIGKQDLAALEKHQTSEGGFHYLPRSNHWDLSNTQYAALGLRAAAALELDVDKRIWMRMSKAVERMQDNYGGFGYSPMQGRGKDVAYASMTAAGIAVLAICRQQLGENSVTGKGLDKELARGWQWFARNLDTLGSPTQAHSFYFHYGLERAAILCDVEKIGETDWYAAGAKMFVDMQMAGGGWLSQTDGVLRPMQNGRQPDNGAGDPVATSFAILFLRRKFQKVAGPITQRIVGLVNIGPQSRDEDVATCAEQLVQRGKEALPEVLKALRSEIEQQRRAAATALTRLSGETFGFDPGKGAEENRDALRAAELWYLRNR